MTTMFFTMPTLLLALVLSEVRAQKTCDYIAGLRANRVGGTTCTCGSNLCSKSNAYCDGTTCFAAPQYPTCANENGETASNVKCSCGSSQCVTKGMYTTPFCFSQGGKKSAPGACFSTAKCAKADGITQNTVLPCVCPGHHDQTYSTQQCPSQQPFCGGEGIGCLSVQLTSCSDTAGSSGAAGAAPGGYSDESGSAGDGGYGGYGGNGGNGGNGAHASDNSEQREEGSIPLGSPCMCGTVPNWVACAKDKYCFESLNLCGTLERCSYSNVSVANKNKNKNKKKTITTTN